MVQAPHFARDCRMPEAASATALTAPAEPIKATTATLLQHHGATRDEAASCWQKLSGAAMEMLAELLGCSSRLFGGAVPNRSASGHG